MPGKIVTLAMFHDPMAAEFARNRLAAEGIPAMLSGDNAGSLFGGALGMVELQVAEENLGRAARILDSMEEADENAAQAGPAISGKKAGKHRRKQRGPEPDPAEDIQPADRPLARPPEPGISPHPMPSAREEDEDEPQLILGADDLANRAWRAAIFGLIVLPPLLHFYSVILLLRVAFMAEEPGPAGLRKIGGALVIDLLAFAAVALLILSMWS